MLLTSWDGQDPSCRFPHWGLSTHPSPQLIIPGGASSSHSFFPGNTLWFQPLLTLPTGKRPSSFKVCHCKSYFRKLFPSSWSSQENSSSPHFPPKSLCCSVPMTALKSFHCLPCTLFSKGFSTVGSTARFSSYLNADLWDQQRAFLNQGSNNKWMSDFHDHIGLFTDPKLIPYQPGI